MCYETKLRRLSRGTLAARILPWTAQVKGIVFDWSLRASFRLPMQEIWSTRRSLQLCCLNPGSRRLVFAMPMKLRSPTEKAATVFCPAEARLFCSPRECVKPVVKSKLLTSFHLPSGEDEQALLPRNHPLLNDTVGVAVVVKKTSLAIDIGRIAGKAHIHVHDVVHLSAGGLVSSRSDSVGLGWGGPGTNLASFAVY